MVAAAAPFGLAPIAGSHATVGVAGFTLGGGYGPLSRRHGFAADNLLRADVVTADGERLTATADRNADLFWALRGGGGNFGVVTGMEIRLHPLETTFSATASFARRARRRDARLLPRLGADPAARADHLGRPRRRRTFAIRAVRRHGEDAARALRPLFDVAGPRLGFEEHRRRGPRRCASTCSASCPRSPRTTANEIEVRYWGGAMAEGDAPVGHRDAPFSVTVDGTDEALAAQATGGSFLNFLHDTTRTETAYTPANYARLREVKRAYDPDNVFALGHNIAPARAKARAA